MKTETLHEMILATMKSNKWGYAFSCGYCHGKDDAENNRKQEFDFRTNDEFAMGYHKGFDSETKRQSKIGHALNADYVGAYSR